MLSEYDATQIVGLRTIVCGAAILNEADDTIEVPKLREVMVTAAVALPYADRLRGVEIKAIRKIIRCTLAELAKKLDERTAPETASRWESETQPMASIATMRTCAAKRPSRARTIYPPGVTINVSY